jgi:hypothetical protein
VSRDARLPPAAWEREERDVASVYGSILAGAAVVVAAGVIASSPGQVLLYTGSTMLVVWLTHSFALFVGHGGRLDREDRWNRGLDALETELPVLASTVPALVAMAVAWIANASVATTGLVGLIVSIASMCVTAGLAARRTGAGGLGIAAAVFSALLLGGLLVIAKVALK